MAVRDGKGWFRRKKGKLVYYWYNANGNERSKVVGPNTMTDEEGWLEVGMLGLDKLVNKPDPSKVTFGEVLQHYLAYGKKKTGEDKAHSSKITDGRNARLHLSHWSQHVAKDIEPLEIQGWIDGLSKGLRSKLRNMMSAVYSHGQKFRMIPRTEESNPMKWVSATTVSDYEAVSLSPEESFATLERIGDPFPSLILPGRTKEFYYETSFGPEHEEFFSSLWWQASAALRRANRVVLCGYSMLPVDERACDLLLKETRKESSIVVVSGCDGKRIVQTFRAAGFESAEYHDNGHFETWVELTKAAEAKAP
jgi:hypothetical protein